MSAPSPILFIDRDGTLIEEPADLQVDALAKVKFMPGVFAALAQLRKLGYRLAMVTNQDGLGTSSFPQADFDGAHQFMMDAFSSQGIEFDAVFMCPHFPKDACECRKPKTRLVEDYVREKGMDAARSAMIGDRDTDLVFAQNLNIRGMKVKRNGTPEETWPAIVRELTARRARTERKTKETHIEVAVDLDASDPIQVSTGIGFFDHMLEQVAKHGGFSLKLNCKGDLHIDEHHTVEDCALALGECLRKALGNKAGIGRYGFLLAMDESQAQVAIDLSGRAYATFEGKFNRDQVGGLPTELVSHFFRSLADTLGAAVQVSVKGENSHHMVEACFKGVGRALRAAFRREGDELPTTKGVL